MHPTVEPMSAAGQLAGQLELARSLRDRGWRLLPLKHRSKQPAPGYRWGSLVRQPQTDAELEEWFGQQPRNVGVAAGASGLVIIDADTMTALAQAAADRGAAMPQTYTVRTAKGRHYYFTDPDNRYGNSPGALKPYGCDVRGGHGDGGYVVSAGSVHETGVIYTVELDVDPIPLLPWIAAMLQEDAPSATVTELPGIAPLGNTPGPSRLENAGSGLRTFTKAQAREYIRDHAGTPLRAVRAGGGVNVTLNNAAVVCGHFVHPVNFPLDQAREYLAAQLMAGPGKAAGWSAPDREDAGTIASGLARGMAEPYLWVDDDAAPDLGDTDDPQSGPEGGQDALRRLVAQEWAREEFARQRGTAAPEPDSTSLTDLLAEELPGEDWRIEGLWPAEGKVLLAAPRKAGKTTITGNLIRCLVDGDPFLGRPVAELGEDPGGFAVHPTGRRVVLLDFEMTRRQLQRWLREQRIRNTDLVHVELLRGKRWDPTDPAEAARWAEYLRGLDAGTIIVDPAGPVVAALDRDENGNGDVRRFLGSLDALVAESGADELFVLHHTGHAGERSRGASAWEDWPDAIWRVAGEVPETFFSALGRDVDQESRELHYDRPNRRLWLGEATRAAARSGRLAEAVGRIVSARPGIGTNELREALKGKGIGGTTQQTEAMSAAKGDSIHTHQVGRKLLHFTAGQCHPGCAGNALPSLVPPSTDTTDTD